MALSSIDLVIVAGYLLLVTGFGCWFGLRGESSERFMAAGRSLPGWAVGLSIFGSYISSISFLANPADSYAGNWNMFLFSLATLPAAWVGARWFAPFYRRLGNISAYEHLERRFGAWARTYSVLCFLLTQVVRTGTILYLLALALKPFVGGDEHIIIAVLAALMIVFPLVGGTEAVVWTGVVQSAILVAGVLACVAVLILRIPGGPAEVWSTASLHDKFSLGSADWRLDLPTVWVVLAYGLVMNLHNFGVDQSYVQRYITARSDREAQKSIWLGASLYVPLAAVFFWLGTALFAFYQSQPDLFSGEAKQAFPHFIATQMPVGLRGLVIAALCAAAMDSSLNASATLVLCDLYKRYFRPQAPERESLLVLRTATLVCGILSMAMGFAMIKEASVLQQWSKLAGIFTGGVLGLFLLGLVSKASGRAGLAGVAAGVAITFWMWLGAEYTPPTWLPPWLDGGRAHSFLIPVFSTSAILLVGLLWPRSKLPPPSTLADQRLPPTPRD